MKKLMVAVVSAASAIFAFGDDFTPHGADFEAQGYVVGESFTNYLDKADDATIDGTLYWRSGSEEIGNIAEHSGAVGATVPDYFTNAVTNAKYLQLESGNARLYRDIAGNEGSVEIKGEGIYLDTLVKFSAASSVFDEKSFEEADKLAIEYVGELDEGNFLSNFVVRAGFIGNELLPTNYLANVPNTTFDVEGWHRLTIRALADIDGNKRTGFRIYLDGQALVYFTDRDDFAKSAGIEDNTHTIFPSIVETTKQNYNTISSVAFSGTGGIDDVVFTTTTPKFIKDTESVVATFTADSGVTAITVTVDNVDYLVDMNNLSAALPPGTAEFTVKATIDGDNDYTFAKMTYGGVDYNTNPATITGYTGGEIAITTTRNNFSVFDENGDPISGTYTTLGAALAAQGVAKIQLAYDYTVADWEDNFAGYTINKDVVLDLNGKTINGGSSNSKCMFAVELGYTLTVVNSVDSDNGKIVYGGTAGVFDGNDGDVVLGSTSVTDYGLVVDGAVMGERGYVTCIYRGKFLAALNSTEGNEFICDTDDESGIQVVDGDSETSLAGAYWVVTPQQIIGTYTVTVTPAANATYAAVYKEGGAEVVFENDVAAVTVGQTITVTATPASGYEYADTPTGWTAGQDGKITIEISAEETVAIPAPTAVSSSDLDPASNTPVEIEAESEVAATNAVQLVTPSGVDATAYKALFDFTVTEVTAGAKYEVSIAGIKESVEVAVEESAMAVLAEEEDAKVVVPAGLYYKITTYTTLGGAAVTTQSNFSDGTGVSVSRPGDTQGFIKIEMATVPFN